MISKLPPLSAPSERNLNALDVIMEKAIMDLGFSDFNKSLRLFDPATGMKIPRYLIYDIISLFKDGKQQDVGNCNFNTRLECIQREIVNPRNKLIQEGQIHKESEPFRIRIKQFWDITETKTLLGPKFTKEQLGHEPDGLIFQPVDHVSFKLFTLFLAP